MIRSTPSTPKRQNNNSKSVQNEKEKSQLDGLFSAPTSANKKSVTKSANKINVNDENSFDSVIVPTAQDYAKEYHLQNKMMGKIIKQRLIFLQELDDQENILRTKSSGLVKILSEQKNKINIVDQEINTLIQNCEQLTTETAYRQDKLLLDKLQLSKKEVELQHILDHNKEVLNKIQETTLINKKIKKDLKSEHEYYNRSLSEIKSKNQAIIQDIKDLQDSSALDTQLQLFISQKQILNEKLQTIKGNIRVYCRIRPLKIEEKLQLCQKELKKKLEENQSQIVGTNCIQGKINNSIVGKQSASNKSISKSTELTKGIIKINEYDIKATITNEMNEFVQKISSDQDDSELYSILPYSKLIQTQNGQNLKLVVPLDNMKSDNNLKEYSFNFEHIFEEDASQMEVFSNLQELIQSVLDGYNVCIFAYGPTGSGKTYTMQGEDKFEEKGIIPRSIEYIFQEIEKMKHYNWNHSIKVRFCEIYNENIIDLLHNETKKDEVLDINIIDGPLEIFKLLQKGYEKRKMKIDGYNLKKQGFNSTEPFLKGSLNLIDLAGSERLNQSNVVGDRLKETMNINKSLTALMDVITNLSKKEGFIPYRNSKLTYYLQEYLGGQSKTLMLVNISPCPRTFHSTLTTLRFADKTQQIQSLKPIFPPSSKKQSNNQISSFQSQNLLKVRQTSLEVPKRHFQNQSFSNSSNNSRNTFIHHSKK